MRLPEEFITRMKEQMKSSGITEDGFFESFDTDGLKGIRINRMKSSEGEYGKILSTLNENQKKVDWCDSGFYVSEDVSGNSPYYHGGVFYPQEPSAMLPAQVLSAKPGDIVMDLCAAPGGKSCRIAEDLKGEGILIANEISEPRSKALLRNVERMGLSNVVILNEDPINMRKVLPLCADKIIVDAPCSGEGMFRRDPGAVKSWEKYGPSTCSEIQASILESADMMLKPGGDLVYSTCTFCELEDEEQIADFLSKHPDYTIVAHPEIIGVTHADSNSKAPGSMRIWPHLSEGDGHFCVHLHKAEDESFVSELDVYPKLDKKSSSRNLKEKDSVMEFMSDILSKDALDNFRKNILPYLMVNGSHIFIPAMDVRVLRGLKTVKNGLYLGETKSTSKGVILIPSHSLALALDKNDIKEESRINFSYDDNSVLRYLKGETLTTDPGRKGNVVITVEGYPLGFGKRSTDGIIKNLYPKAWRLL